MVPIYYYIILSAILFTIGVVGVLIHRNALIIFMSIELMKPAIMNPKSPTRLTIKAFLAASEFAHEGRASISISYQKPIRRNEHNPTPSQPTKSMR